MSQPDPEQTYQALRRAMIRAQNTGVRIICEAFDCHVTSGMSRVLVGVCALGAENYFNDPDDATGLPDDPDELSEACEACEAIEAGFDDVDSHRSSPWYQVGLRLRDEFYPITAKELERELGVDR